MTIINYIIQYKKEKSRIDWSEGALFSFLRRIKKIGYFLITYISVIYFHFYICKIGFAEIFQSKDSDYRHYNGMRFKVLKNVSVNDNRYDLEILPMWHIQLSNGVYADAYPEEIVADF